MIIARDAAAFLNTCETSAAIDIAGNDVHIVVDDNQSTWWQETGMELTQFINDLERTRDETLGYFALPAERLARTYGPGKWSVRYVLHHLVDSETVLYYRIRRVLCEPRQVIWVYDQSAWAAKLNYAEVPLELMRPVYESTRAAIIYYAGRHFDQDGGIEFVHSTTGLRTLRDEFEKVASHNEHHLRQIRSALSNG